MAIPHAKANQSNSIHLILEIKKLATEPYFLGQVTGMQWEHWIAGKSEGQCASLIGDYMGSWLCNPNSGDLLLKLESLGEAYECFPRHRLFELDSKEPPKDGITFIHLSLFSMDKFRSGFSVAIEGRYYLGPADQGPFTDND